MPLDVNLWLRVSCVHASLRLCVHVLGTEARYYICAWGSRCANRIAIHICVWYVCVHECVGGEARILYRDCGHFGGEKKKPNLPWEQIGVANLLTDPSATANGLLCSRRSLRRDGKGRRGDQVDQQAGNTQGGGHVG